MNRIRSVWLIFVDWFERGDLVPLMVLVSAVHYAAVLAGKDSAPVAIAIGLLVDLGHYRTIRAAVRYTGDSKRQAVARWLIATGMTALSLNYHQRYYQDFWLSAPLPLLIAALAWLQKVDQRNTSRTERTESKPASLESKTPSEPAPLEAAPVALYRCVCGFEAKTQAALNGHKRKHAVKIPLNGKAKDHATTTTR